jgi:DNA-binding CsgD family transcriptional regulator
VQSLRRGTTGTPISSPNITKREMEFLRLCATELSYKEMAAQMNCSPRTVETYRDALMQKLAVKGRVGLAIYALKAGFAE